jgi:hemoglobin
MPPSTPYQILGQEGINQLVDAFYDAMDELTEAAHVRAMHKENLEEVRQKLKDYLIGWMGGPPIYQMKTGTVCLTDPHAPYAIGPKERDQWLLCIPMFRVADTVRNRDSSEPKPRDPNIIAVG